MKAAANSLPPPAEKARKAPGVLGRMRQEWFLYVLLVPGPRLLHDLAHPPDGGHEDSLPRFPPRRPQQVRRLQALRHPLLLSGLLQGPPQHPHPLLDEDHPLLPPAHHLRPHGQRDQGRGGAQVRPGRGLPPPLPLLGGHRGDLDRLPLADHGRGQPAQGPLRPARPGLHDQQGPHPLGPLRLRDLEEPGLGFHHLPRRPHADQPQPLRVGRDGRGLGPPEDGLHHPSRARAHDGHGLHPQPRLLHERGLRPGLQHDERLGHQRRRHPRHLCLSDRTRQHAVFHLDSRQPLQGRHRTHPHPLDPRGGQERRPARGSGDGPAGEVPPRGQGLPDHRGPHPRGGRRDHPHPHPQPPRPLPLRPQAGPRALGPRRPAQGLLPHRLQGPRRQPLLHAVHPQLDLHHSRGGL